MCACTHERCLRCLCSNVTGLFPLALLKSPPFPGAALHGSVQHRPLFLFPAGASLLYGHCSQPEHVSPPQKAHKSCHPAISHPPTQVLHCTAVITPDLFAIQTRTHVRVQVLHCAAVIAPNQDVAFMIAVAWTAINLLMSNFFVTYTEVCVCVCVCMRVCEWVRPHLHVRLLCV